MKRNWILFLALVALAGCGAKQEAKKEEKKAPEVIAVRVEEPESEAAVSSGGRRGTVTTEAARG
ncbi:MAG: hypothetical protein ACK5TN_10040, partial [Acidobacteriota bacterium]